MVKTLSPGWAIAVVANKQVNIIKRFDYKSQNREDGKKNFLSIFDIWNVQYELQDKFNISDQSSQKITWDVYGHKQVKLWHYG